MNDPISDHDLLVRIDERVKSMDLKLEVRIVASDALHLQFKHEIDALKSLAWQVTGALSLGMVILTLVMRFVVR